MRFKHVLEEFNKIILVLIILFSQVLVIGSTIRLVSANPAGSYNYEFIVDEEGFTNVNIVYTTEEADGSSWVLVPTFTYWVNNTIKGTITEWSLRDPSDVADSAFKYFYEVLFFSFKSDNAEFELDIQFNVTTVAMIIEPDGIFYSPQIGFESGNKFEATVVFPSGFRVNEALAYTLLPNENSNSYNPSSTSQTRVVFSNIPETENLIRIEIGFNSANKNPELEKITNGIFSFETVSRYAEYARSILDLYNRTYNDLVDLFNVTLDEANVKFFIPDFASLFVIAGYVPFTSNKAGDININFVFTRYLEGYIEVFALHELVHHFLWKAGISPNALLWFHEGMAQYVSMEIADKIGYEGAGLMIEEMETSIYQLKNMVGEDFGFIQGWSLTSQPQDVGPYYIAAYYIVRSIAENHGGLEFYTRFFEQMNGETVTSNAELGYYLSLASEKSVAQSLNSWGFNIPDLYLYSPLLGNIKKVLNEVNPLYQPYKYIAELLYEQALSNARQDSVSEMNFYLSAAITVAKLAPLLTTITVSGFLFTIILMLLKRRGVFWNY